MRRAGNRFPPWPAVWDAQGRLCPIMWKPMPQEGRLHKWKMAASRPPVIGCEWTDAGHGPRPILLGGRKFQAGWYAATTLEGRGVSPCLPNALRWRYDRSSTHLSLRPPNTPAPTAWLPRLPAPCLPISKTCRCVGWRSLLAVSGSAPLLADAARALNLTQIPSLSPQRPLLPPFNNASGSSPEKSGNVVRESKENH